MSEKPSNKLNTFSMTLLVISAMLGGGIYSLPQNMAREASLGAILIAWGITGIGIFLLALSFIYLVRIKSKINGGIYAYAKEMFGDFVGFLSGWSYYLANLFSIIALAVMAANAMNYFVPNKFTGGNNLNSILLMSCFIWIFNYIVLKGVKKAAFINSIATITKIIPLLVFIIIMLVVFQSNSFVFNFWGGEAIGDVKLGNIFQQVKSTMMTTLWTFIGIETAIILSGKVDNNKIVRKSTLIGFFVNFIIYVLISILPFGFMGQVELAKIADPSTAGIMEIVLGKFGAYFMSFGVIISVLSCWLSWVIILAETPLIMAEDGTFPKIFKEKNKDAVSIWSIYITSILMQISLIIPFLSSNAWQIMVDITGIMILPPYTLTTLFLIKITLNKEFSDRLPIKKWKTLSVGIFAFLFSLWLIYSAGFENLLLCLAFYLIGVPFYIIAKIENNVKKIFNKKEILLLISIIVLIIFGFLR